jgi:hypothetical protein
MDNIERAADRLIELYGSRLGLDKPPPMMVYFDPEGQEVPFQQVWDSSPGGMQGQVEYADPTPGHGFYAMFFLKTDGRSRDGGTRRVYEISGPDWALAVEVRENMFLGSTDVSRTIVTMSEGGERFLARFTQPR